MKNAAPYNTTDYLKTPEDVMGYLNAAIEDGDERVLLAALKDATDAMGGMSWLSRETGLSRESLYRALAETGNPRLSSLTKVLGALGLEIAVRPRKAIA